MKKYYFTFGQSHNTIAGLPMKDYWVTVEAESYGKARELFCQEFAVPVMGGAAKWSFQYEAGSDEWEPKYFPGGQYVKIIQPKLKDDES